ASTGTIALHRWRTPDGANRLWLANGKAPTLHSIDLPLAMVSVSSGFGARADPFGRRWGMGAAKVPQRRATGGPAPKGGWRPMLRVAPSSMTHNGVDFAAPSGTPVYAASDGVVLGARPNGGYGNWIQIDHPGNLSTVYGHLSGFAPGIKTGVPVSQGELIGFVGSTGRSTGPHLHFELLSDGAAVDPMIHREVGRAPLNGHDLERFRAQVARAEQESVARD
ncbi:MAG: M23 family metallopeptidase, partial [Hyphomicrobium sp.]|nr:M23 family metallopeptidase [Hyphomicrobium sp.]